MANTELPTFDALTTENAKQKRRRQMRFAFLAAMLLFFVGDRVLNGKRGEQSHQQLLREFAEIKTLPNASVFGKLDSFSPWNSHKALVGAKYTTDAPYTNIRDFYNTELESHGWRFVEEKSLRDVSGHELMYCKGSLSASVQYEGERAHHGWTYALDLRWGLNRCN